MAKSVVIDEILITVRVPRDLPDDQAEEIRQVLASDEFQRHLGRAVRAVVRTFDALAVVRVTLTR